MKCLKPILLIILGLLLTGSSAPAGTTRLEYRLKWLFNTSVAGDILAQEAGFFSSAGLDVRIKEGGPGKNAIKELELGQSDFGTASADQVIRALDKGANVVVLAQLFQVNPMQWILRADQPGITTLADLKSRHIGITFGGNDEIIMNTLLAKGLTLSDVKISSVRFDFTPFLLKKVEIWPVYRNSQGVILEERLAREGEGVRFFNPSDFGVDFVANSVVTSEKMIKENPEIVNRFMAALIRGWEFAMDSANEAAVLAAVKKRDKSSSDEIRAKQLAATRPLIKPEPGTRIGRINTAAWQQTLAIMVREKQVRPDVDITSRLKETL